MDTLIEETHGMGAQLTFDGTEDIFVSNSGNPCHASQRGMRLE